MTNRIKQLAVPPILDIETKVFRLEDIMNNNNTRITQLSNHLTMIFRKLTSIHRTSEKIETRVASIETDISDLKLSVASMAKKQDEMLDLLRLLVTAK